MSNNNTARVAGDQVNVYDTDGCRVGYVFKAARGRSVWVAVKFTGDHETRVRAFTREGALRILGVTGYTDEPAAPVTCADCGASVEPSLDYEPDLWKTVPDGRHFCGSSRDALHHPML